MTRSVAKGLKRLPSDKALFCPPQVGDLSIHESVATFTALLIARSCFSLEDVIYHVALPSLLAALPSGKLEDPLCLLPIFLDDLTNSRSPNECWLRPCHACVNISSGRSEIIALGEWVREWKEGEGKRVDGVSEMMGKRETGGQVTYPSPNPSFYLKSEIRVKVELGEG